MTSYFFIYITNITQNWPFLYFSTFTYFLIIISFYFKHILNLEISHSTSSKILSQSTHRSIKFSILVHIENFHSFVTSKTEYESVSVNFNNKEWFIVINLYKYCQTDNKYIVVTSSSPEQPEFFAAFVYGGRSDKKECSFDVNGTFKFKRPSTAKEVRCSHKFSFNSTNYYYDNWGCHQLARIDVILALLFSDQLLV